VPGERAGSFTLVSIKGILSALVKGQASRLTGSWRIMSFFFYVSRGPTTERGISSALVKGQAPRLTRSWRTLCF
jgi:hypothetical protein